MSEMLGNQYFMTRNYKEAVKELEPVYLKEPSNKHVKRKLIISYTQIGKIKQALELFISLVKEDVGFIINADPIIDDCPCPEIIEQLTNGINESESLDINIYKGILWQDCDPKTSIKFLEKAVHDFPKKKEIKETIKIIKKYIQN